MASKWAKIWFKWFFFFTKILLFVIHSTVKLGFKEWLDKEQLCNSEPFPVTNMPDMPKSSLLLSLTVISAQILSLSIHDFALLSHFFWKKLRFSYILQDFLFGSGVWIWAVENLRSSHHAFVVCGLLHDLHAKKSHALYLGWVN